MHSGIFLIQGDGLNELREQPYPAEEMLQSLLADYPNLLVGDQVSPSNPRRWVLITREAAVPGEEGGSGRWALDHLFLDQEGIPTLVEVKRSADTRIRREVVGQMLDYAANAVLYWPTDLIRTMFESRCEQMGLVPDAELQRLVGSAAVNDEFWQTVELNLRSGRIRMVFVADVIPAELQRIVEYLNEQMSPTEVLAVEIRQYVGQDLKALVPRVLGMTAKASQHKGTAPRAPKQKWDETSFFAAISETASPEEVDVARTLLAWQRKNNLRIWWGEGATMGSFYGMLDIDGSARTYYTFSVWTYGTVEVPLAWYKNVADGPFKSDEGRQQLLDRLNAIDGLVFTGKASVDRRPGIKLALLADSTRLKAFLSVFDWVLARNAAYQPEQKSP